MKPASRVGTDQSEPPSRRERLMSPGEVARFLGVPLHTLYRWRSRGDGPPGYRLGRHLRYRVDDVERWLEDHRDGS
jgi:excisionase family DNA binding protein